MDDICIVLLLDVIVVCVMVVWSSTFHVELIECCFGVFVFPGPRPWHLPPAPSNDPQFVFTGPGPQFVITGPGLQFAFTGPGPNLYLLALAPNFYLPVLASTLCLPQICIYRVSPGPEFAYTDLISPICIYWPWPTICTHTGC